MAKYDTVIFDMDGTTLNTLEDLADSVNYVMKKYGYPVRSLDEIRCFLGNGVNRLMELSVPGGLDNTQFNSCLQDFKSYYELNSQNKTAPYAGISELMVKLHEKNYKLAIVSNKLDEAVKQLNEMYFGQYIQIAIGDMENVRRKPAPDSVYRALGELGSLKEKTVYVGDSEVDVQTARNAGIICVGVTWGFRDRSVLADEGADFIIDNPDDLLNILE